jgi:hypothetical protein
MKKGLTFLTVFVLIAIACFFNPVLKQGFAQNEKKIKLAGFIRGSGSPNFLGGASWVDVSGNYAFVIGYFDNSLSVFDITDPSKPSLVKSLKVDAYPDIDNGALSIFVSGNYAYVYHDTGVILIYDISDAAGKGPDLKGKIVIGPLQDYMDYKKQEVIADGYVFVQGILAYTVDEVSCALKIIDVSDVSAPTIISSTNGNGTPNYLGNPHWVTVKGDYAYIGTGEENALSIFNIEDPRKPVLVSAISGAGEPNHLDDVDSIFLYESHIFVAAGHEAALSIIDVSNPANPVFNGYISGKGSPNYLEDAIDVKVVNDYAYVSAFTDNAISVYDVSDVTKPVLADVVRGSGKPNYLNMVSIMDISGNYLYAVSMEDNALVIFDISDFMQDSSSGNINTTTEVTTGNEGETATNGTTDDGEVSILRQWLRIHNPNSI